MGNRVVSKEQLPHDPEQPVSLPEVDRFLDRIGWQRKEGKIGGEPYTALILELDDAYEIPRIEFLRVAQPGRRAVCMTEDGRAVILLVKGLELIDADVAAVDDIEEAFERYSRFRRRA